MLFDGRYRIVRKLGSGGMADVYLAEDEELGRRIAIKILNDRHANDEQFVERFRREAKNAAGLSHPNIVSIYDRGEAEGTYYIAMEYLDGRSLKELVVARGPLPIQDAIDATRQVLAALRFAHRKGIVHRDIKPHNVMADADGRLKVTDFGIARAGVSQMTEAGSIIGTAQYLSPEQARGAAVDQRSDLYSIGVVLYEMLTGQDAVQRRVAGRDRDEASLRPAAAALAGAAGHLTRPGHGRAPRAREEPGRPLPDGRGDGRRAGARLAGPRRDRGDCGRGDDGPVGSRSRRRADLDHSAAPATHGGASGLPVRRASAAAPAVLAVAAGPASRRPRRRGRVVRVRADPGLAERLLDGLGAVRRRPARGPRRPEHPRAGARAERAQGAARDGQGRPGVRPEPRRRRAHRQGRRGRHHGLDRAPEGRGAEREGPVTRRRDRGARGGEAETEGA